jgi:hypothetical protein
MGMFRSSLREGERVKDGLTLDTESLTRRICTIAKSHPSRQDRHQDRHRRGLDAIRLAFHPAGTEGTGELN